MKTIIKTIAAVILLGSICFLGGEWPEDAPRDKVIACDGCALAAILVCGIYLKKEEDKK